MVVSSTSPGDVRNELARCTGNRKWHDNHHWQHFMRNRKLVLDSIYAQGARGADWSHPTVCEDIDKEFIIQARYQWTTRPELDCQWAVGEWLDRSDLVAWVRSNYWRSNKKSLFQRDDLSPSKQGQEAIPGTQSSTGISKPSTDTSKSADKSGSATERRPWEL